MRPTPPIFRCVKKIMTVQKTGLQVVGNWRGSACWPLIEDKWPERNMQSVYCSMQLEVISDRALGN